MAEIPAAAVIMVPAPAQGHLNQLLHFSRLLAARNIPVHYVAAAAHLRQARARVHGWDPSSAAAIHFHEVPNPPFDNPPPNPNAASKFPSQLLPSLASSTHLRRPVHELVQELSATARRLAVVYESVIPYVAQDVVSVPNAEAYCFHSSSAFSDYAFAWEIGGKPPLPPKEAEIFERLPSIGTCFPPEVSEVMTVLYNVPKFSSGDIFNTSRAIEGTFLDLLAKEKTTGTDKIFAVGPFHPISSPERKDDADDGDEREETLKWLDKHNPNSVILISFGSTCSLSDDQVSEIAAGLERSGQNFVWVVREADRGNIFEGETRNIPLPEEYEERVRGRGLIIKGWAPQLAILGHVATGGFLTHCGWNSCIESISMGVPMAAWPMHSDQPINAALVTRVLGIGFEVREWDRRDDVVPSETVERVVRRVMASEEGEEIRKRAQELGDDVRNCMMEGGVSFKEMDSFVEYISR